MYYQAYGIQTKAKEVEHHANRIHVNVKRSFTRDRDSFGGFSDEIEGASDKTKLWTPTVTETFLFPAEVAFLSKTLPELS